MSNLNVTLFRSARFLDLYSVATYGHGDCVTQNLAVPELIADNIYMPPGVTTTVCALG